MALSKETGEKIKKYVDILMIDDDNEPEIREAQKKILARLIRDFVGEEKKQPQQQQTTTYASAAAKPIDPYEFTAAETVTVTHMINFQAGMYHWMSDIRTRSLIKLRQDFEIEVRSKIAGGRFSIGFCLKSDIKWVQLSLLDVGVEIPDGQGKYITVKVKLVRMIDPVKPALKVEDDEWGGCELNKTNKKQKTEKQTKNRKQNKGGDLNKHCDEV